MLTWPNRQENPAEREDYRNSHSFRGLDYDEGITSSPLDAYMDRWEGRRLIDLIGSLCKTKISRYLDFACGTGRITRRVEPFAENAYGVDISESMLNIARKKCPNTHFICADLTRDKIDLGTFDLITSFRFFGNAQDELRESALSAIHQRLRPGGYFILNNHRNPRSLLGTARRLTVGYQETDLSYYKLKRLLKSRGFKIVDRSAVGFWIYRFKFSKADFLASARAARLEHTFRHSCFAPFSLDAILVAQKI